MEIVIPILAVLLPIILLIIIAVTHWVRKKRRAKVDPGCDATQRELMLTTKDSTTTLPGLDLRV